jgi:hypothetical protein
MQESIIIPARFRGPPESGNGGYVAGVITEQFAELGSSAEGSAIEVTLRAPTPLDRAMTPLRTDDDSIQLILGETLIAEARRCELTLDIPEPPSFASALAAQGASPSFIEKINPLVPEGIGFHPICFCCGADVAPDEGLHVYAAPVAGFDGVAAAWQPSAVFADPAGNLPEPVLWAALDCPGQFAYLADGIRTGMLGRMTGRILKPVPVAQELTVIGWCIEVERLKHFAGTALFDESSELCGYSKQVWIGRRD